MITRIESFLRRLRRYCSRSEWLARLLGLSLSKGTSTSPGLVMIQIDGLSQAEFEKALARGEMPFLHQLIEHQQYRLHRQYSGIPASTAAFQGELFYGVRTGVPGFNFMERASGNLVRMFEPAVAARVERKLAAEGGHPLLSEGSCYADNFTGGAAEPHFCPSAQGWGPALREANPLVVMFLIISNGYSFLRTVVLLVVELVLAMIDFARGLIAGHDFFKELKFIPTRVAIVILLRELATIGVKMDVARGLPVIHINFLGYDEQAHRRGPDSRFAHWSLKGIDDAIARLWRAAHRSARRHYDIWIYSDHGQERTQAYEKVYGRSIAEAIAEVFSQHEGNPIQVRSSGSRGVQLQRGRLVGGKRVQRLFPANNVRHDDDMAGSRLTIAPLGPVIMIYDEWVRPASGCAPLAQALIQQARVPLILVKEGTDRARAWTEAGEFILPEQGAEVLGADHPFMDEVAKDLVALCHHPDAGDYIVGGWRAGSSAYSFAIENGAHGGIGPNETNGFALLPSDVVLPANDRGFLRALDLRQAALHFLGYTPVEPTPVKSTKASKKMIAQRETLRIMTYNVHSCIGMDGKLLPERIARVIARYGADIVALQELDVGRIRTDNVDQAHLIARYLEMDFHFHPAMHIEEERYGDAILTHLPMRLIKAGALPGLPDKPQLEPRGALWVEIDIGNDIKLQVINTHLGLLPRERRAQVQALIGSEWLAHPDCRDPVVLCGDLNALPFSSVCRDLRRRLFDAQIELERHRPRGTFFGRLPAARIDYIFSDKSLQVMDIEIPNTQLVRVASDHLPLIAELKMPIE